MIKICSMKGIIKGGCTYFSTSVPSAEEFAREILLGRRDFLARGITLVESSRVDHKKKSQIMLNLLAEKKTPREFANGLTIRIGIAGPPGAGKSTFIEKFGLRLIEKKHRVAVIPVDPSSHISGGSILGDKTRMELLTRESNSYIRASPTRGVLGGIAEHTVDVITLCEAANFDTIIIESVGLGQSEVDIDRAVDMLLVIVPPGGGDGLQASKKGIMEAADLVIVNKADGNLLDAAKHTKADYSGAMQFIRQKHPSWRSKVLMMSSNTGAGMDEVEEHIRLFHKTMSENGQLVRKRADQAVFWMWGQLRQQMMQIVEANPIVKEKAATLKNDVAKGKRTPAAAAGDMVAAFLTHSDR